MKKLFFGMLTAMVLSSFFTVSFGADFTGEYENKISSVTVNQKGNLLEFVINSSVGQNTCYIEGTAEMVDKTRAAYTNSTDPNDKCVVVFNFDPKEKAMDLKVTTKACDGSCGMNAAGSMDGLYKKKKKQPTSNSNQFFSNQKMAVRIIDKAISEGMLNGHYGCVLKAQYFLVQGSKYKNGSQEQMLMDKIAWYNIVNAHRMLNSIYHEISSKKKQEIYGNLESLDSMIATISKKSFGWDENQSREMYGLTRELIESRIMDVYKDCFGLDINK